MPRQPNAKLQRLVDATSEPLSLALAKQVCRVNISADDNLIPLYITAARMMCETEIDRSFITTTWELSIDYFPPFASNYINTNILPAMQFGVAAVGGRSLWINLEAGAIRLPMPPLIAVSSIELTAIDGSSQTIEVTDSTYAVVSPGTPGQIAPQFGVIFPITRPVLSGVQITYTAGYGPDASYVPASVVVAISMMVADMYVNRTTDVPMPQRVKDLLDTERWGSY